MVVRDATHVTGAGATAVGHAAVDEKAPLVLPHRTHLEVGRVVAAAVEHQDAAVCTQEGAIADSRVVAEPDLAVDLGQKAQRRAGRHRQAQPPADAVREVEVIRVGANHGAHVAGQFRLLRHFPAEHEVELPGGGIGARLTRTRRNGQRSAHGHTHRVLSRLREQVHLGADDQRPQERRGPAAVHIRVVRVHPTVAVTVGVEGRIPDSALQAHAAHRREELQPVGRAVP